ncbi:[protein-PII] uridylyltransferase [Acidithiobacillus sp.]|uniref:[protein-PII] uridylyltransferase n=1 Tax=Acidithiobacillus sp. TaxID=1872118 RepID=UPI0025BF8CCD|nr:[protein-PII] uridylyltransferase [Acidithiobacillus sp.]
MAASPVRARLRQRARWHDQSLRQLWREANAGRRRHDACLIAVGGYGRGTLFPGSDLDLLVLVDARDDPERDAFVSRFFTLVWDQGFPIGHSVRSVAQCLAEAHADLSIATTLHEMRFLAGSTVLYRALQSDLETRPPWDPLAFYAAKIAEQDQRHRRFSDTAYHLEPNIKDGPGGLRDVHQLLWLSARLFGEARLAPLCRQGLMRPAEYRQLLRARAFLETLREQLHLCAGRGEDRLRLEYQEPLARQLGFHGRGERSAVERMMQRLYQVFADVLRVSAIVQEAIGHFLSEGRHLSGGAAERSPSQALSLPEAVAPPLAQLLATLAQVAERKNADALEGGLWRDVHAMRGRYHARDLTGDPAARAVFLEALRDPVRAARFLTLLHDTRLLGRLLPPYQAITGLIQHDLFHVYTVDQHTLFVLKELARLWQQGDDPLLAQARARIPHPELLVLAALFHDIAKGQGGDHSSKGAELIQRFAHDMHLEPDAGALLVWLVHNHLLLSTVSQRRDLEDPQVIRNFAERMGNQGHLAHLFLLTIADMRATNPDLWNDWKASLLRKLFDATWTALEGGDAVLADHGPVIRARQAAVLAELDASAREPILELWQEMRSGYFLRYRADELLWQAQQISAHHGRGYLVRLRDHPVEGSEILIYGPDKAGLFEEITATLDRHSLNILDARIDTSHDGRVLDTFVVLDESHNYARPAAAQEMLRRDLRAVLHGEVPRKPHFGMRHRDLRHRYFADLPLELFVDNDTLAEDTLLEIRAPDRLGLLYRVGGTLRRLGFNIFGAKVSTFGESVEDTFFIRNAQNRKLRTHEIEALTTALREALGSDGAVTEA